MNRFPLVNEDTSEPTVREVFDQMKSQGRALPDVHRMLAHSPVVLRAFVNLAWPMRYDLCLRRQTRLLVIMLVARLTHGEYEWAHHWPDAVRAGLDEDRLRRITTWREHSAAFDASELALLEYVELVCSGDDLTHPLLTSLRSLYSERELVEITVLATFYLGVSRMTQALGAELEPEYVQYRINGS